MKRLMSIFCAIIMAFMFSACATFKSVEETDAFLAAERAKGIKPKTKLVVGSVASNTTASSSLSAAGSVDSLWQVADIVGGSVLAAPLIVGGLAAKGLSAAVGSAEKAATAEENLTRVAVATTDYGRFVEYSRSVGDKRDAQGKVMRDSQGKIIRPPSIFDAAIKEVGAPPAPCMIANKHFDFTNNYGNNHKLKRTFEWCSDEKTHTFIGFAKVLKYGLAYRTVLPENAVPGQAPAICTEQMAREHFSKIVKIMEDR